MMHLGLISDEAGMIHFNMGEAKAAIDLLDTLESRTSGYSIKIKNRNTTNENHA